MRSSIEAFASISALSTIEALAITSIAMLLRSSVARPQASGTIAIAFELARLRRRRGIRLNSAPLSALLLEHVQRRCRQFSGVVLSKERLQRQDLARWNAPRQDCSQFLAQ